MNIMVNKWFLFANFRLNSDFLLSFPLICVMCRIVCYYNLALGMMPLEMSASKKADGK